MVLPRVREFCNRHYRLLAVAILAIAAFNLGFRLNSERVEESDESLYGLSAWEMVQSGDWIATTRLGTLDYYNTKPPLNVWLIAAAFKAFGTSLLSLRLASAVSAWVTVAVLLVWAARHFGRDVGLASGLVLATCFGFVYVHSGKNADTDAAFTLLILLTVVTLHAADRRPWALAWLGPIAAATFMLRGMAVLMPLLLALIVLIARGRPGTRRLGAMGVAVLLGTAPVARRSVGVSREAVLLRFHRTHRPSARGACGRRSVLPEYAAAISVRLASGGADGHRAVSPSVAAHRVGNTGSPAP